MATNHIEFVGVGITNTCADSENQNTAEEFLCENCPKNFVKPDPVEYTCQPNIFGATVKEELSDHQENGIESAYFEQMVIPSLKSEQDTLPDIKCESIVTNYSLKCEVEELKMTCDSRSNLADDVANISNDALHHHRNFTETCTKPEDYRGPKQQQRSQCSNDKTRDEHLTIKIISKRHRTRTYLSTEPYQCSECRKNFSRSDALKMHLSVHHKLRAHSCPDCVESFRTERARDYHRMRVHLKCPVCDMSFEQMSILVEHQESVHQQQNVYNCPDCDKNYSSKSALDCHHKVTHLKLKPYECPDCENRYALKGTLKVHWESIHLNLKPYKCPDCEKSFYKNAQLKFHQASFHHAPKSHRCPDCEKNFYYPAQLKAHQVSVHRNYRSHECQYCKMSFYSGSRLGFHQRSVHRMIKPLQCPDCGKSFYRKDHMNVHQASVHQKLKSHNCPECNKRFSKKVTLTRHLMSAH